MKEEIAMKRLACLLTSSALVATASAQSYVVQDLPTISSFGGRAFDLNGAGVAVGHGLSPTLQQHALVWPGSGVTDLTPSNALAEASGISEGGLVAGWARNPSGATEAVRWTSGVPSLLGWLPGHIGSFAQDVSDSGLVAGWSVTTVGDPVAVVWTGGTIQAIGPLQSWAFAVSEAGDVAGHRWVGVEKQGFRWRAGVLDLLPDLGLGSVSAVGISPGGRIAGSAASPLDGHLHGVVWGTDLAPQDLGLFRGVFSTAATDASDAGVAVGGALNAEGDVFAAIVWRGAGAEDLNTLIQPGSGWILKEAQAVNERGEIVGIGQKGGQASRPFILRPDCDGDGLSDLAEIAAGTAYDANGDGQADACQHCQPDLGFGGPGSVQLSVCGDELTGPETAATLALSGAPAGAPLLLAVGLASNPTPLFGGVLVPLPPLVVLSLQADGAGALAFPIHGAAGPPAVLFAQAVAVAGAELQISNAVQVELGAP